MLIALSGKVAVISILFCFAILLCLESCTHDPVTIDMQDPICFDTLVMPMLKTFCGQPGCHGSISPQEGFDVSSYQTIMQAVTPGDPRGSTLYKVITDINSENMMPPNGPLTIEQRSIIEVWIAQGALQNACNSNNDTSGICFVQDILPMILSNCGIEGCHDAITHEGDYVLVDYNSIMEEGIVPFNPNNSKIYEVVTASEDDLMPPYPKQPLTTSQISALREWILDGAPNSDCPDAVCDTLNNISFTSQVDPIIQAKCVGCHNTGTMSGGVDLSSYSQVLTYAQTLRNGTPILTGVIRRMNGFQPMPPTYSLDDCTIRKIELWIEQGAADN
jgi:hypothetical protein